MFLDDDELEEQEELELENEEAAEDEDETLEELEIDSSGHVKPRSRRRPAEDEEYLSYED